MTSSRSRQRRLHNEWLAYIESMPFIVGGARRDELFSIMLAMWSYCNDSSTDVPRTPPRFAAFEVVRDPDASEGTIAKSS
ncbi:hypothetical protein BZM26_37770 [Paraburkholderia strydomiana]|nr:hypothetical protein BZM26_37770 [Paraburkholderia strydomiana]